MRTQTWEKTTVRRALDEMVYLQPEYLGEKYSEWVEVEASNIARSGTHIKEKPVVVKDPYSSDESPDELDVK